MKHLRINKLVTHHYDSSLRSDFQNLIIRNILTFDLIKIQMTHQYDSLIQTILPGSFPKVPWFDTSDHTLLSITTFQNDAGSLALSSIFLLASQ